MKKKLVWDKTGERLYETGVSQGVLYPIQTGGVYNSGTAWNGLSTVTESPSGAEPSCNLCRQHQVSEPYVCRGIWRHNRSLYGTG